jgi:hypothetical protein
MKTPRIAALSIACLLALSTSVIAVAQNPTPGPAPNPETPAAAPARPGLVVLDFKPGLDDLMTMLVQPRHIRLYYAGQAKNWPA